MQCKSDDCTEEAVAKVIFPWSAGEGETVVCQRHLKSAEQLMTNLNRSSELKVLPLVAPGVEVVPSTPAPVPADPDDTRTRVALAAPRPTEERLTHQLRAQCLALELDLEKQRGLRIAAELELVREGRSLFDYLADKFKLSEFIAQIKSELDYRAVAEEPEESVVDGPAPTETHPPESPGPEEVAKSEAQPPPPDLDVPPHAP